MIRDPGGGEEEEDTAAAGPCSGDGHLFTGITGVDEDGSEKRGKVVASSGCRVGIEWVISIPRTGLPADRMMLSLFILSPVPLLLPFLLLVRREWIDRKDSAIERQSMCC